MVRAHRSQKGSIPRPLEYLYVLILEYRYIDIYIHTLAVWLLHGVSVCSLRDENSYHLLYVG